MVVDLESLLFESLRSFRKQYPRLRIPEFVLKNVPRGGGPAYYGVFVRGRIDGVLDGSVTLSAVTGVKPS